MLERIDAVQRRRPWLAFPVAVLKKFGDDRASRLAALVSYYGFFSLFPLLLVLTTGLGFVLAGNEDL
ncbi:MAG TPA: ribonuclease BN, partial [Acidimicrobiia bacterium]